MTMMKAMSDEALRLTAGGDNGDSELETRYGLQFYDIGQYVKVYKPGTWHLLTRSALIIDVEPRKYSPTVYCVQYGDGGSDWVYADDIKRDLSRFS